MTMTAIARQLDPALKIELSNFLRQLVLHGGNGSNVGFEPRTDNWKLRVTQCRWLSADIDYDS
jgi:hypothetical protein